MFRADRRHACARVSRGTDDTLLVGVLVIEEKREGESGVKRRMSRTRSNEIKFSVNEAELAWLMEKATVNFVAE